MFMMGLPIEKTHEMTMVQESYWFKKNHVVAISRFFFSKEIGSIFPKELANVSAEFSTQIYAYDKSSLFCWSYF